MDCIFCQIVTGEVTSNILYQDEQVIVFPDINPLTRTHLLIVPRKHIPSLAHLSAEELSLIGDMTNIANQLAKKQGISTSGYRLVINCGEQGGQGVPHLHMHLLGGRQLSSALG